MNRGRGLDTPLHAAARVGGAREVELLLEHGADGNCRNSEGKRAVELAEQHSKERLILQSAGKQTNKQIAQVNKQTNKQTNIVEKGVLTAKRKLTI